MPQRDDDIRRIVAGGRAKGLSDDDIRRLVTRYDAQQQAEASRFSVDKGRQWRAAPSLIDKATDMLPVAGGMAGAISGGIVGGMAGGIGAVPGSIGGAAGGGALGEWGKQRLNAIRGKPGPETLGGRLSDIATQGAGQGVLEGIGAGSVKALRGGARFFMNSALRPGLRVLDDAGNAITGPGKTLSARFPGIDINEEALRRGIPIRNSGLRQTQTGLTTARQNAMDAVTQASNARPRVAGLLPEGRTAVPLGETPVPSGGTLSLSPSHAIQRVPFNAQRQRQGMSDVPAVTQFYGGTAANNAAPATADVVEGAGVWMRPGVDGPRARLMPGHGQMVGVDEVLAPARAKLAGMANTALPARKQGLAKQINEYAAEYPDPANILLSQRRKDVSADEASRLYRAAKGAADDEGAATAQFHELLAEGNRGAVETRVPNIRAMNAETQTQLALRDALLTALDKESRSSRFTMSGALDNPRLWGGIAHGARRTAPIMQMSPQAIRAAIMAAMSQQDE